jgi:hypothetical protein
VIVRLWELLAQSDPYAAVAQRVMTSLPFAERADLDGNPAPAATALRCEIGSAHVTASSLAS